MAKLFDK